MKTNLRVITDRVSLYHSWKLVGLEKCSLTQRLDKFPVNELFKRHKMWCALFALNNRNEFSSFFCFQSLFVDDFIVKKSYEPFSNVSFFVVDEAEFPAMKFYEIHEIYINAMEFMPFEIKKLFHELLLWRCFEFDLTVCLLRGEIQLEIFLKMFFDDLRLVNWEFDK